MTNGNGNGHRRPGDEPDDWTPTVTSRGDRSTRTKSSFVSTTARAGARSATLTRSTSRTATRPSRTIPPNARATAGRGKGGSRMPAQA